MQEFWFVMVQLIVRSSLARLRSVVVNSGAIAIYRAAVLKDNVDVYLNEKVFGRRVTFSDDSLLTLLALVRGRTVQVPNAFAITLMPQTVSHHRRQQLRWMRGSMLRSFWRLRLLPVSRIGYWYSLAAFGRQVVTMQVVFAFYVLSIMLDPAGLAETIAWSLGLVAVMLLLICIPYLFIRRSDQSGLQKSAVVACAPLASLWFMTFVWAMQLYSMLTFWKTDNWGTRSKVEVALNGAGRPGRLPA
jgi:hyaluronan synthase